MNQTLAIVGSHPRTRNDFDFTRQDCDVWIFNEAVSNHTFPRADAIFQMHVPTIWRNPQNRNDPGHYNWLQNQTEVKDIWMQDIYPDVPASRRYPLEDVRAMLHDNPDHFLSSSVPQAVALAILQGYSRIEIYGVAMETNTEYQWQREGVAFWRGFAMGRGIDFYFADPTYKCLIYGYDTEVALSAEVFEERIKELGEQIEKLNISYTVAATGLNEAVAAFENGDNSYENITPKVAALLSAGKELGLVDGGRQENERYMEKAKAMLETTGDFVFSRQEFEGSAAKLMENVNNLKTNFAALGGQLGLLHKNIFGAANGSPKRAKMVEAFKSTLQAYMQANNMLAVYSGAMLENRNYMQRLDAGIRAAGGEKSEAVLLEAHA